MDFKIVMSKYTEPEHSYDHVNAEYDVLAEDTKIGGFTLSIFDEYQPDFTWHLDQAHADKVTSEDFLEAIFKYLRGQGFMHVDVSGSYRDYSPWLGFILTRYDNSGWEPRYDLYRCLYDFDMVEDLGERGRIYALTDPDSGSILCSACIRYGEKMQSPTICGESNGSNDQLADGCASLLACDFQLAGNTKAVLSEFLYNLEIFAAQQLLDQMFIHAPAGDPIIEMLDKWELARKAECGNQPYVLLRKNVLLRAY